jgi:hypothetical protein
VTNVARAWDAFMQAIIDARHMHERGAEPFIVDDLVRHARELLDIIEAEIAEHPIEIPGAAGAVLSQLRGRLRSLERIVGSPALH